MLNCVQKQQQAIFRDDKYIKILQLENSMFPSSSNELETKLVATSI